MWLPKKFRFPKKSWSQKIWGRKKIGSQKMFDPTMILSQKKFWSTPKKDLLILVTFGFEIFVPCNFPWRSYKDGAKNFRALVFMFS